MVGWSFHHHTSTDSLEQPPRIGLWYIGTGTGTIIGALASFGFQHYTSKTFTSWQILFLLMGLITIAVGICVVIFMPDNPMKSRLTRGEKIWAIERLRENQTGIENKRFKPSQALECLRDPQTWMLSLITVASNVPNGAVSSFQATIIKGYVFCIHQAGYSIALMAVLDLDIPRSRLPCSQYLLVLFQLYPFCQLRGLLGDITSALSQLLSSWLLASLAEHLWHFYLVNPKSES